MTHLLTAIIHTGDDFGYVAECLEVSVVTQGNSLDEVVKNCTEAVFLRNYPNIKALKGELSLSCG